MAIDGGDLIYIISDSEITGELYGEMELEQYLVL